jgi:DNA replication protein DnaC
MNHKDTTKPPSDLDTHLQYLKLAYIAQHYNDLARQASRKQWGHVDYLGRLIEGETALRHDRSIQRRIHLARFPVIKTLDQFN